MKLFTVESIRRMSAQRRHNFQRRLEGRLEDATAAEHRPSRFGPAPEASARALRAQHVLSRFHAIASGSRPRS